MTDLATEIRASTFIGNVVTAIAQAKRVGLVAAAIAAPRKTLQLVVDKAIDDGYLKPEQRDQDVETFTLATLSIVVDDRLPHGQFGIYTEEMLRLMRRTGEAA